MIIGHFPPENKTLLVNYLFVCLFVYLFIYFYLFIQVLKLRSILWSFILQPEASDEEFFTDVKEAPLEEVQLEVERSKSTAYQMGARNPLYCRAETSCLWELAKLQTHYHPSVQAFSRTIAAVSILCVM